MVLGLHLSAGLSGAGRSACKVVHSQDWQDGASWRWAFPQASRVISYMAAGLPRVTKSRDQGTTSQDLALEVTFHLFQKIQLVTQVYINTIQSLGEFQEKGILGGHLSGWRPQRSLRKGEMSQESGERKIWRTQNPGDQKSPAESSPTLNRVRVQRLTTLPWPTFHSALLLAIPSSALHPLSQHSRLAGF